MNNCEDRIANCIVGVSYCEDRIANCKFGSSYCTLCVSKEFAWYLQIIAMSSGIINKNNVYLNRRSIRLQDYDYAKAGAYYITICTDERENKFGDIIDNKMALNQFGEVVHSCWTAIPAHFPHVELDEFVVMPNHVHGIIFINQTTSVGANNYSPLQSSSAQTIAGTSKTIGSIIRGFKIGVTKYYRENGMKNPVWQRNYYEHIIRDNDELNRIREYIFNNPANWGDDEDNPGRRGKQ